jgi:hypothetical protein
MDFDRYARAAFEASAASPDALRALADQLQDDILSELDRVLSERFAVIVAELNRRGHNLTAYDDQSPGEEHARDYTDPNRCALRLAYDVIISAGFEDVRAEGGRGRPASAEDHPR